MERKGEILKLVIEDDGMGIRAVTNPLRPSFGMAGMRERISTLGGHMRVVSAKGEGTKISVTVPIPAPKERPVDCEARGAGGPGADGHGLTGKNQ